MDRHPQWSGNKTDCQFCLHHLNPTVTVTPSFLWTTTSRNDLFFVVLFCRSRGRTDAPSLGINAIFTILSDFFFSFYLALSPSLWTLILLCHGLSAVSGAVGQLPLQRYLFLVSRFLCAFVAAHRPVLTRGGFSQSRWSSHAFHWKSDPNAVGRILAGFSSLVDLHNDALK